MKVATFIYIHHGIFRKSFSYAANYRLFLKSVAILKGPMVIPLTVTSIWPGKIVPNIPSS